MQSEITRANGAHGMSLRFDVKALRLATHGWLLGNPLVYKPGAADLAGIARQLALAGSSSGTLALGDASGADGEPAEAILILRLAISREALGAMAAEAIVEVAEEALGRACVIRASAGQWDVARGDEASAHPIAYVSLAETDGAVLLRLRLAFDALWEAGHTANGQPASPLFERSDWREVFLARALHTMDIRLKALPPA